MSFRLSFFAAALTLLPAGLWGATFDFSNLGNFTAAQITDGVLTVTGSATLNLISANGLAIIGGASDFMVDDTLAPLWQAS